MDMSKSGDLPFSTTIEVRDRCLCLRVQRAARRLARRFDEALRPFGLTHGQFSILMALNRPAPPTIGQLADFLAMDRTTLTANLKPLHRRQLVTLAIDKSDKRSRLPSLTDEARALLAEAAPIWRATHDDLDAGLTDPVELRERLAEIA
ncbi:Transcriptional regulator HosA [Rhizobium sp. EC-SD404]|nr:Transcriptional regulator HosA [Rhizobium sp. EC-SD404]